MEWQTELNFACDYREEFGIFFCCFEGRIGPWSGHGMGRGLRFCMWFWWRFWVLIFFCFEMAHSLIIRTWNEQRIGILHAIMVKILSLIFFLVWRAHGPVIRTWNEQRIGNLDAMMMKNLEINFFLFGSAHSRVTWSWNRERIRIMEKKIWFGDKIHHHHSSSWYKKYVNLKKQQN